MCVHVCVRNYAYVRAYLCVYVRACVCTYIDICPLNSSTSLYDVFPVLTHLFNE